MTTHSPTLPPAVSTAVLAPPLSVPIAAYGRTGHKHAQDMNENAPATSYEAYIPNPLKMFDRIVIHPVAWPDEALRWMGVPRSLPTTPLTFAHRLSEASMSASARQTFDCVADALRSGKPVPREDLGALIVDAFTSIADAQNVYIYRRARAYLSLADLRVRMEPMHGFSGSGVAPVLAYLDEAYRKAQREKLVFWRSARKEGEEVHQDDEHVEVMDVATLYAMAQEHKRWGVPADADGNYTTRVMYPNNEGNAMILLTAVTPAETVAAVQEGRDMIKRVTYNRQIVDILGASNAEGWDCSPLLQLIHTLVEEGGRLARKAPTPRWPIGPWAWTTHF